MILSALIVGDVLVKGMLCTRTSLCLSHQYSTSPSINVSCQLPQHTHQLPHPVPSLGDSVKTLLQCRALMVLVMTSREEIICGRIRQYMSSHISFSAESTLFYPLFFTSSEKTARRYGLMEG